MWLCALLKSSCISSSRTHDIVCRNVPGEPGGKKSDAGSNFGFPRVFSRKNPGPPDGFPFFPGGTISRSMGGYPIGAGQTLVLPATQILVLIFPAKFFGEMAGRLAPLGEMAGGSSTCTQYVISSEGQTNRTGWFRNFPQGNLFNSYVGFYRGSTTGMHVRHPPGMDLSGSGMSWVL